MHRSIRLVGLSTALANVKDVAEWLGVNCRQGLFNFSPSVRPVPCETHIRGRLPYLLERNNSFLFSRIFGKALLPAYGFNE
jgi:superfamily II RNA helicase